MKISFEELKGRLTELIKGIDPRNPTALSAAMSDFLQFSVQNYESLDDEAKAALDKAFDSLRETGKAAVDAMPEGVEKRQALRLLEMAKGNHFSAEGLLRILESPSEVKHPVVEAGRPVFLDVVQHTLEVLFDTTRHTHEGAASFAKIGLSYWMIDELLSAFHLAQRAFTNQAYTHIRTVFEILDKIDLFDKEPKWAAVWVNGDEKEVWNELRPAKVREKLGEPKHDPVYSYFSRLGPHASFEGLQDRSAEVKQTDGGRRRFSVWVGGCPMLHQVVWTHTYCIYTAFRALLTCIKVFRGFLNEEEMKKTISLTSDKVATFLVDHHVEWAKKEGLDYQPLLDHLQKGKWRTLVELD
ncbi:MAG: hypothetical protein V3S55_01340 [Nitrospiraceae bacterium]